MTRVFAKYYFQNVFAHKTHYSNGFTPRLTLNLFCLSWAAFSTSVVSPHTDEFLELLASSQSRRLDDQRASFSELPGLRLRQRGSQALLGHLVASSNRDLDDDFFDILIKCQVRAEQPPQLLPLGASAGPPLLHSCKEATVL